VSTTDEMDCEELVERVTEYLDGALDPALRRAFESHVGECPGCNEILDQFRAVVMTTGALRVNDAAAVDPDLRDELLGVFRSWQSGRA
jgi:anti-sigma factor RsiW